MRLAIPSRLPASGVAVLAVALAAGAQPAIVRGAAAQSVSAGRAGVPDSVDFAARYREVARLRGREPDGARLRRLLAAYWDQQNVEYPEFATYTGYPGQNARWTDYSPAAVRRRRAGTADLHAALRTIDPARVPAAERLNHELFRRQVEQDLASLRFPVELLAVSQLGGPQYLADVVGLMPARTAADYRDILARLDGVPAVVDQTVALLDSGLKVGVTQPRVVLRDVVAQLDALVSEDVGANPITRPFTRIPASVPEAERDRLRAAAATALARRVAPAYRRLRTYLADTYVPRARETVGLSALPDGRAWYAFNARRETTIDRAAEETHRVGLAEVARIRAAMDSVMRAAGFAGTFAEFTRFLRTDPRFYHSDSASLVRAYRDVAKRADPGLVRLFGRLPRTPYGVGTIPSYSAPSQTTAYYEPGSPDVGRPGFYMVNTYKLDTRPTWEMEALTLHEAVPGHHLQIALAQELGEVPAFRRYTGATAFVEGWALYAESLGPELGFYADPYSKFGQLTYEIWRAIRLVLDTGIHALGWTRQQAIDYFVANSAKTEHDIVVEVDRYIASPGQALAYKTGELRIRALRADAERQLGGRFDVRAFHDVVLGAGAVPLDVLEERVRAWVAREARRVTAR
jgi:uncharacterized protein (DUF885 family)